MCEALKLSDFFSFFQPANTFQQGEILNNCNIPGVILSPVLVETLP